MITDLTEEEETLESAQFIAALRNGHATIPKLAELIDLRFMSQGRRFREHRQEHREEREEARKDRNRIIGVIVAAVLASPGFMQIGLKLWEIVA